MDQAFQPRCSFRVSRSGRVLGIFGFLAWLFFLIGNATAQKATPTAEASVLPGEAARVNGRPIPRRIVDVFVKNAQEALGVGMPGAPKSLAEVRSAVLSELIDRELVAQSAEALGGAPGAAGVKVFEEREKLLYGSEAGFVEHVAKNGFTLDDYRQFVLGSAANGVALTTALTKDLQVSEEEIRFYYEAHRTDAAFQWQDRVAALHILFNTQPGVLSSQLVYDRDLTPNTPAMSQAIAEETERQRLLAEEVRLQAAAPGADFAALATKHSDDFGTRERGGMLGVFVRGTHAAALDEALFKLSAGEVGPVVKTEYGFHVVKTLQHLPAGPYTLAEATPFIRERLLETKRAERLRTWLKDKRAQAVVVRAPDDLPGKPVQP